MELMPFMQSTFNSNGLSFSLTFLMHTYQEVIVVFKKVMYFNKYIG